MITSIINTFRQQAKEHKSIRAFYYDRSYEIGSGKDKYPLLWLECPMIGRNQNNVFSNTMNFSILFIPDKDKTVEDIQNIAFSIGLNIIERMRQDRDSDISILPNWSYLTLRNYYDDNAAGCRFTVNLTHRNMQNLCLIDDQFDTGKVFDTDTTLKGITTSVANNCEIFVNKFPSFDLKTKKDG